MLHEIEARLSSFDPRLHHLVRLVRYYGVAAINALWGYGVYAGLVALGLNLFVAQIIGQLLGVLFNYFSYSLGVFQRRPQSGISYIIAYILNYLACVSFLALFHSLWSSPYLAGLGALICASLLNFFILSRFVFR